MPDNSRTRWPFALLVVVCAAAVVGVLVGATAPLSAAQFANSGHWVYNSVLGALFHVDGATTNIDAQLAMEAEAGSQVLQSDTSGFVVGEERITEFDKESLKPQRSTTPPTDEVPLGIEVVGGPYAVYREAGTVVRLGDPTATVRVGGSVGDPVVTEDGTMWLHRTGNGQLCRLTKDAVELGGCPVSAPKDHGGALTLVGGKPAFVDLYSSQLHAIDDDKFGEGVPLGVSLSPNSRPATQDADGRLAILDPAESSLILVDTSGQAGPVTVALPSGDYEGPVSTGEVVALVDRQKGTVLTFGADGKPRDEKPIKDKTGEPRLSQGEDKRIYVEDADGTQVLVVGDDGSVQDVDVAGKPVTPVPADTPPPGNSGPPVGGPPPGPQAGPPPTPPTPPALPPSRPGVPLAVAAQAGNGSATVTWGPAADNRSPITSYVVTWQGGSLPRGPGDRQATIPGLANGTSYTFTVTAINAMGPGPGASSNPVTPNAPVAPAAAPVNLVANYDANLRPARDVTLTWGQPDLRGGTLVHYEISGLGPQTVTSTQALFSQVPATQGVTFTVRAVTRTPDGQFIAGEPATANHQPVPPPQVTVSKGDLTESFCGNEGDDCAWMNVVLTGFDPDTDYHVKPFSSAPYSNTGHTTRTDPNGYADIQEFAYSGPGHSIWVEVRLGSSSGPLVAQSDPIVW